MVPIKWMCGSSSSLSATRGALYCYPIKYLTHFWKLNGQMIFFLSSLSFLQHHTTRGFQQSLMVECSWLWVLADVEKQSSGCATATGWQTNTAVNENSATETCWADKLRNAGECCMCFTGAGCDHLGFPVANLLFRELSGSFISGAHNSPKAGKFPVDCQIIVFMTMLQ